MPADGLASSTQPRRRELANGGTPRQHDGGPTGVRVSKPLIDRGFRRPPSRGDERVEAGSGLAPEETCGAGQTFRKRYHPQCYYGVS